MNTESMKKCAEAAKVLATELSMSAVDNMTTGWFADITGMALDTWRLHQRLETMYGTATNPQKCDVCKDDLDGDGIFDGEELLCEFCDEKKHGPERLQELADHNRDVARDAAMEETK